MSALLLAALVGCDTPPPEPCLASSKIPAFDDVDGDGYGDPATERRVCQAEIQGGVVSVGGDCDDANVEVSPDGVEVCDGLDNDCNTTPDDSLPLATFFTDADADGFGNPLAPVEACNQPPGAVFDNSDCDDSRADVNPIAAELCDGVDNDCDLRADDEDIDIEPTSQTEWHRDSDGDGFGDTRVDALACENPNPARLTDNGDDCDDDDGSINPLAVEVCDGIDNDCDTYFDESDSDLDPATLRQYFYDGDGDGSGDPYVVTLACEQPYFWTTNDDDCDDSEPLLEGPTFWTPDVDQDGYGQVIGAVGPTCDAGANYALQIKGVDCDDNNALRNPGEIEACDGFDNDCDNRIDDADVSVDLTTGTDFFPDADGDGFGAGVATVRCAATGNEVALDGDCRPSDPDFSPAAIEICDSLDNDCDLLIDEADPNLDSATLGTWYPDVDGDGLGDDGLGVQACDAPTSIYVDVGGDCDDADPDVQGEVLWLGDSDGDGYGAGMPAGAPSCTAPFPGTVRETEGVDCAPSDPTRNPGAADVCGDGIDQDCSGADRVCPPVSCAELLANAPGTVSGIYEIEPVVGQPVLVYCDMSTDGGGWTLVGSSGASTPLQDVAIPYHGALTSLSPGSANPGVWDGLAGVVGPTQDLRFACKTSLAGAFAVDLSFYGVSWYDDVTADVVDAGTCFLDAPTATPPARRNNLTATFKPSSDAYNTGVLQGENSCGDTGDFTVDFDDRGLDGNESDGTDWGLDDGAVKCATKGAGQAWFLFVR